MQKDKKIIAIGDIHGCSKTIEAMLETLESEFGNHVFYVFLGDYTDRGSDSKKVVDQLLEFNQYYDCIFLRGNHDQMLLDAYEKAEWDLWLSNGGETTLKDYNSTPSDFDLPKAHYDFFNETQLYWETEDYFFVHAGISPDMTIQENLDSEYEREQFMWQRSHIYTNENKWEKTVVFGHTPVEEPMIKDNMIGIDTGCVYDRPGFGVLTAILLPDNKIFQQKSLDV